MVRTYDSRRALTIDPVLESAALLGGSGDDRLVLADPGSVIVGSSVSADFPGRAVAAHRGSDIFIYQPETQSTTILGGSGDDIATCASLSSLFPGTVLIGGYTNSRDFPIAPAHGNDRPPQPRYGGGDWDGFLLIISTNTSLYFSTYLGGSGDDRVLSVNHGAGVFGAAGSTTSTDFPLAHAWQNANGGGRDGFVAVYSGYWLLAASYLGGPGDDQALAFTMRGDRDFYVGGETRSTDWTPAAAGWTGTRRGPSDGFVIHGYRESTSAPFTLLEGAFYGGSGEDRVTQLAALPNGALAVAGIAGSSDFAAGETPLSGFQGGASDVFLVKASPDLKSVSFGALIGGSGAEEPLALATNSFNELMVAGWTNSTDFPVSAPVQPQYGGGASDGFLYYSIAPTT